MTRKQRWVVSSLLAVCVTLPGLVSADEPAPAAPAAPPTPGYFAGANEAGKTPVWPDPTGAASGVWATPAGDGKGDVPSTLGVPDLYDRIAHNMFSINIIWT